MYQDRSENVSRSSTVLIGAGILLLVLLTFGYVNGWAPIISETNPTTSEFVSPGLSQAEMAEAARFQALAGGLAEKPAMSEIEGLISADRAFDVGVQTAVITDEELAWFFNNADQVEEAPAITASQLAWSLEQSEQADSFRIVTPVMTQAELASLLNADRAFDVNTEAAFSYSWSSGSFVGTAQVAADEAQAWQITANAYEAYFGADPAEEARQKAALAYEAFFGADRVSGVPASASPAEIQGLLTADRAFDISASYCEIGGVWYANSEKVCSVLENISR